MRHTAKMRRSNAKMWLFVCALMAAEWILLVAGVKLHEMIVGAFSIAASAVFLYAIHRTETQRFDFQWSDVFTGWRVPGYLLSDLYQITVALLRDLLGMGKAGSFYRVCDFKTAKAAPRLVARRVLATAYTSATPNSIVIGIDYEQNRLLLHQVVRSPITKMARLLGAEP
jgi:hypothetical protein